MSEWIGPELATELTPPIHDLMSMSDSFLRHFAECHDDPCGTCTNIRVCFLGSLDALRESARRTLRLKAGRDDRD